MSNLSGSKRKSKKPNENGQPPKPETASPDAPAAANSAGNAAANSKVKRWSFIQNDLEKALDTWEELEKTQATMSPEEEQLEKIKTIIGQLKDKLNQF